MFVTWMLKRLRRRDRQERVPGLNYTYSQSTNPGNDYIGRHRRRVMPGDMWWNGEEMKTWDGDKRVNSFAYRG